LATLANLIAYQGNINFINIFIRIFLLILIRLKIIYYTLQLVRAFRVAPVSFQR